MPGGDRSVGREDQAGGGERFCLLERDVPRLHQAQYALQAEKGGMALIHVINRGFQPHRFESAIAANAEKNFLLEPHFEIATVKLIGNLAVFRRILRRIRVEQKQLQAPYRGRPDLRRHRSMG